ncbi:MAG: hypothetical protein ACM3VS_01385 [Candidatus Dadabacteria bacterium]
MYNIAVKIESIETKRRNAGLLHIILGFFLVLKAFDFYQYGNYSSIFPIIPLLIVAGLSLYYGFFRKRFDYSGNFNQWIRILQVVTFTIFGFAMLRVGKPLDYYGLFLWAFLSLILLVSERHIYKDTIILLSDAGIIIPTYYKDQLVEWHKLSDVIIRHDFVTIFNRNEKYLQFQVMQTLSELELAKMNAFCKEKLEGKEEVKEVKDKV